MRLCPALPGNPRRYIEGESPRLWRGTYSLATPIASSLGGSIYRQVPAFSAPQLARCIWTTIEVFALPEGRRVSFLSTGSGAHPWKWATSPKVSPVRDTPRRPLRDRRGTKGDHLAALV